jgi:DNA-binding transcriptional MerR regulator
MGNATKRSTNQPSKPKSLQFTVQREEAREAVGITPKQLRIWQEEGLFIPELGKGSQRFTEADVQRLTFLRRLILELGLPVSTVKELYASFYQGSVSWPDQRAYEEQGMTALPAAPENYFQFLDLRAKKLINFSSAFLSMRDALVRDAKYPSVKEFTEEKLKILMAIRASQIQSITPTIYLAELEALLERLREVALAARVQAEIPWEHDENSWFIHPSMPDDPDLSQDELEKLWHDHHKRIGIDLSEPAF